MTDKYFAITKSGALFDSGSVENDGYLYAFNNARPQCPDRIGKYEIFFDEKEMQTLWSENKDYYAIIRGVSPDIHSLNQKNEVIDKVFLGITPVAIIGLKRFKDKTQEVN
ncbi:hypothetical protein [Erwinia sp. 9145]|uniref:hypothetical protein n=1 Tax=Erwinia sp. 9145 TaxID=1500895 RepID=UPI0005503EB8|nr:hypothetical protein [Erwinia sp. 9145]